MTRPTKGEPVPEASPELPRRRTGEEAYSQAELLELVRELLELRRYSDPAGGEATEPGKDDRAHRALFLLGVLVRELGQWAILHHAGRRLFRVGPALPPSPPSAPPANRETVAEHNRAADRHVHQQLGLLQGDYRPEAARGALADVLRMLLPIGWPPALELVVALEAMNHGQLEPLLALDGMKNALKQRPAELAELRLKAVECMFFRQGRDGLQQEDAAAIVADAFGVGSARDGTARSIFAWREKALDKERNKQARAANRSRFDRALDLGRARQTAPDPWKIERFGMVASLFMAVEAEAARTALADHLFGDKALERAGGRYRELKDKKDAHKKP